MAQRSAQQVPKLLHQDHEIQKVAISNAVKELEALQKVQKAAAAVSVFVSSV